jgi:GT2 family glycosyltransferase
MDKKKVATIVVTYNRLTLLQEEIESLRKQTFKDNQIVVINNGSTDGTLDWLKEQKDIITVTQGNLGGAGGFNTGMRYAAENGYEYCWVMDDDVICSPSALQELYDGYHKKENIGFVCSKVSGIDGRPMNTPVVDNRGTNGYGKYYDLIEHQMIKVKEATFVSVFLSTNIIKEIGLPIKEFFIWGDDTEYTNRISQKHDSYLCCKSEVVHKRKIQGGISFDKETDPIRLKNFFYMIRNNSLNNVKYRGGRKSNILLSGYRESLFHYFLRGKYKHACILFKAMSAFFSFNPSVEYPDCTKNDKP